MTSSHTPRWKNGFWLLWVAMLLEVGGLLQLLVADRATVLLIDVVTCALDGRNGLFCCAARRHFLQVLLHFSSAHLEVDFEVAVDDEPSPCSSRTGTSYASLWERVS